jgi:hypothetical protein
MVIGLARDALYVGIGLHLGLLAIRAMLAPRQHVCAPIADFVFDHSAARHFMPTFQDDAILPIKVLNHHPQRADNVYAAFHDVLG